LDCTPRLKHQRLKGVERPLAALQFISQVRRPLARRPNDRTVSVHVGIKLHYHPLSTYSPRVLIAFAEKQIPHELIVADMAARRHREQPYYPRG
jgi:hypothetical protein